MVDLLHNQAEAYSRESFQCGNCRQHFEASVVTWVDVSKTPQARQALLKWRFNIIQCTHCGCRHFSGTPFFYEDFEEGLLVAVFPAIPEKRGEVEKSIRQKYGYYPVQEFFYDMTQIWMLLYFQDHYKVNKNLRQLSRIGEGEKRLRTVLQFLKENPLMIDIREKLTETFFGDAGNDHLVEILGRAVYLLEEMLPWPTDHRCLCGADLAEELKCCGRQVNLSEHQHLLSRHYVVYCQACKEALSGASCEKCGRVYTWRLGTVDSHHSGSKTRNSRSDVRRDREI
ncbi:MAG: CpXC domain-containing protein [Betaproteobacteria bacterium]